ncbi:peptide synthetase [Crassisporium funariophilum]|nr:peptide synthetase [Crassisporium funariophilum]
MTSPLCLPPNEAAKISEGYSHTEWPDLSSNRCPLDFIHTAPNVIMSFYDNKVKDQESTIPAVLVAIARTLGAYCGASDLLLAVQAVEIQGTAIVRVKWDDEKNWQSLISEVNSALQKGNPGQLDLADLRDKLSLSDKQHPCMALCRFDQPSYQADTFFPATFSYDNADSVLRLSASTTLLHPDISKQIVAQVHELVQHATNHPAFVVSSTPPIATKLLSVFERGSDEAVIAAYSHLSAVRCAPDYLTHRFKDMPRATAVRWYPELSLDPPRTQFESMTYAELHKKSNQVARWLLRLGVLRDDRVAVCLDRNLHFHAAMMGIMRAGGCYVPIDPELPLERKLYIAKDADAKFVLTASHIAGPTVFGPITLYIEDDVVQSDILQEADDELEEIDPSGLAYLLYTSGTTGNPKGCLLTHEGLAQAILALSSTAADVRMNNIHDGRYLAVASIAFDVHLAETIIPFALGMPLFSARRSQLLENLPIYVNMLEITHLGIVPSLIEATLNAAQAGVDGSDIALRYIASGGEKMSDSILDKWANHPQVRLANFYGPSEVTIGCCARYMTSDTPRANIGRPFANVSAYVVDRNLEILLRGSVGELVVEGPLVGRGYHGRPDLTSKVFIEWPRKGCWAYRTGDLVRMMPDSTIEIVGRIDTQIKLRGVRIESEGISAIVRRAAPTTSAFALDAATVLAKHPAIGADQLVSLFSWDKSVSIGNRKSNMPRLVTPPVGLLKRIKVACEAELPSYMRPSHFIPLSWLPLSSNGKTDTKILIEVFRSLDVNILSNLSLSMEDNVDLRQCTETERTIFQILQKHISLCFNEAHPQVNIFECGLDSMAMIRFITDLKDVFGQPFSASDIMKAPRLSDIATLLHTLQTRRPRKSHPQAILTHPAWLTAVHSVYDPRHVEAIFPPFPVQEGVLARSAGLNTLYVQHVIFRLKAHTSKSKLKDAWQSIVSRHQILRTVFHFDRDLLQVVLNPEASKLNWSEKPARRSETKPFVEFFLRQDALQLARDINDTVSRTPPYRISTYTSPDDNYVTLSIHHALFDGISLPQLLLEVEREYLGHDLQSFASVPEVLDQLALVDIHKAQMFWQEYFAGYHWPSQMFTPAPAVSMQSFSLQFKASLSAMKRLAASQHVTLNALLTCAFADILARRVYKNRDVTFGMIRSGRLLPIGGIDGALCPLVSVVPVRVNFTKPHELLREIQQGISSVVEYEHVPLGKVQSWVRPGQPLFEILFSLSAKPTQKSDLWDVVQSDSPEADYPLAVEVVLDMHDDSLMIQAGWIDETHSQTIHDCLHDYEGVVCELAQDPSTYLARSTWGIPNSAPPLVTKSFQEHDHATPMEDANAIDPFVLSTLQRIIADFLLINPAILTTSLSFISVGLDSIRSVGLARKLREEGFPVTSTKLLQNSTLKSLATLLGSNDSDKGEGLDDQVFANLYQKISSEVDLKSLKLTLADIVKCYPTTSLQTGMLSQTVSSEGKLYVHAFPLRLTGPVDLSRLCEAWKEAVRAFAILRTSFHFLTDLGLWTQVVHTAGTLEWTTDSVDSFEDYANAYRSFMSTIRLENEDGFKRPPFWLRVFQIGAGEDRTTRLVFVMHHALYDGISVGKLVSAVESFYKGHEYQKPQQFHDLLPHLLSQESSGTSFWASKLQTFFPARLQRLNPSSPVTSITAVRKVEFDALHFKEVLGQYSITAQCIGQAAWAKVIAKRTGVVDVVFGHTVSGRSITGAEDVIGPVLNTIPCCIRLDPNMRNIDFVRSIHESNIDGLPYQQASLRELYRKLGVDSLWDSLFLFQPAEAVNTSEEEFWTFDDDHPDQDAPIIQYPLNIEVYQGTESLTLKCACLSDYLTTIDLDLLMDDLHKFIENLLNSPEGLVFEDFPELLVRLPPPNSGREDIGSQPTTTLTSRSGDTTLDTIPSNLRDILLELTNAPLNLLKPKTSLVAIGIDSITAIQIVGKFRKAGLIITASDVVSSRTLGDMLKKALAMQETAPKQSTLHQIGELEEAAIRARFGAAAATIDQVSIASSGMKWLIGAWQRSERSRFQHAFAFQLPQDVDVLRMKHSWISLVRRHPILRSTFASVDGNEPRIVTFKFNELCEFWSEDFIPDDVFQMSVLEKMKTLVSCPPPTHTRLTRAMLYHSSHDSCLVLQLHHFQYDAWSLQLLLHELSRLYQGLDVTNSSNMNSFLGHYASDSQHLVQQQEYWQSRFPQPFEPQFLLPILTDVKAPIQARTIRTNDACIMGISRLEERARFFEVSTQAIFLACWARLQSVLTSSSTSTFGVWHSGRTGPLDDIANLAVPCVNVLPMHVGAVRDFDVIELAKRIQEDLQSRTSVIEQSDQVRVNEWVGAGNQPMCNVFVNIIKVAPDVGTQDTVLEPVNIPYFVPDYVAPEQKPTVGDLKISKLIKDDLFIDIAVIEEKDSVLMSLDAAAFMMDVDQADDIIRRWVKEVRQALEP